MNQPDDLDRLSGDAIDQDVVGVDNRFACARHPAGAAHVRMVGQPLGESFDDPAHALRCGGIVIGDVTDGSFDVPTSAFAPDELQRVLPDFFASSIARTSAITWSCGTGGRGSASDSATVRFSHST